MSQRHLAYMRLEDLVPAESNPKTHDLPSLAASLDRYGWTQPIILDERTGRLVAGHGRREVCIWMKEQGENPPDGVLIDEDGEWLVPVTRGWASRNDTEADAYIIADNRISESGGWHMKSLAQMLEEVVTEDATLLDTVGYTSDDLDELFRRIDPETLNAGPDGWADEDGIPDTGEKPDTSAADDTDADDHETDRETDDESEPGEKPARRVTCPSCGFTEVPV